MGQNLEIRDRVASATTDSSSSLIEGPSTRRAPAESFRQPKQSDLDLAHRHSARQFPEAADEQYRRLEAKKFLASMHVGPALSAAEGAKLQSKKVFGAPADEQYRELEEKHLLSRSGGKRLTPEEEAARLSRFFHPTGDRERDIHAHELLYKQKAGPAITKEDEAWRDSKQLFVKPADEPYRSLDEQRRLAKNGLAAKLTDSEDAALLSKFNFPNDENIRKLDEKRRLANKGIGAELTVEEKQTIHDYNSPAKRAERLAAMESRRTFSKPEDEEYRALDEKRRLALKGLNEGLTKTEQIHLTSKLAYRADDTMRDLEERKRLAELGIGVALNNEERNYYRRHRR